MSLMWRVSLVAVVFTLTTGPVKVVGKSSARVQTVASLREHPPIIIRERHGKNATSTNWSGYAVTGAPNSVTDVKASWVVPAIQGACPATNQYASFWVGIDGYSSNTVEQIGTDSDCQNGNPVYYAWYEFYPHLSYGVPMTIQPGDTMSAEVSAGAKGLFTVTLNDLTSHQTFTTTAKVPSAKASSAEWIVEAPYSGGVLPLPNFGVAQFGLDYTSVPNTSYATVGGTAGPIGSFPSNVEITMVDKNGGIKALPSDLTADKTSFTDAFVSSGP